MKRNLIFVFLLGISSLIGCQSNYDIHINEIIQDGYSTNVKINFSSSSNLVDPKVIIKDINGNIKKIDAKIVSKDVMEIKLPYHNVWKFSIESKTNNSDDNLIYSDKFTSKVLSPHYNFAYLNATLPPLLFATQMLLNDNTYPTYICIERAKTYNFNKLPDNVYPLPNVDFSKNMDTFSFINAGVEMSNYISTLYKIDKNSNFSFNYVDNFSGSLLACIHYNNIPNENIKDLTIYSDGSYTADYINKQYKTETDINKGIEYYKWQKASAPFGNRFMMIAKSGLYDLGLPSALVDNATYYVNDIDTIELDENYKNKVMKNLDVDEQFDKLKEKSLLKDFEYLLNTRWGESEDESMSSYFEGSDKNLIIAGTSPDSETAFGSELSFIENINYIKDKYKDYRIFYKGHPRYPFEEGKGFDDWEERKNLLIEYDIKELVSTIPMETLLLLYEGTYVGGYNSTLYTSSKKGQTLFLFGSKEDFLNVENLKASFKEGLFDDTEFIDKNSILGD